MKKSLLDSYYACFILTHLHFFPSCCCAAAFSILKSALPESQPVLLKTQLLPPHQDREDNSKSKSQKNFGSCQRQFNKLRKENNVKQPLSNIYFPRQNSSSYYFIWNIPQVTCPGCIPSQILAHPPAYPLQGHSEKKKNKLQCPSPVQQQLECCAISTGLALNLKCITVLTAVGVTNSISARPCKIKAINFHNSSFSNGKTRLLGKKKKSLSVSY